MSINRNNTGLQRKVVEALLETKAVDFRALGSVVAEFGNALALEDEGENVICGIWPGHVIRFIHLPDPFAQLEDIEQLRAVARQLTRTEAALDGE